MGRPSIALMAVRGGLSALALAAAAAAATAGPLPPLREVKEIDDRMLRVALAVEISDRCDELAPRTLRGLSYVLSLRSRATALGYSDAGIRAYVRSDAEKARMRKRGEAYVRALGLDPTSDADLCTLGRREIEKGTLTGALLKEN